MDIFVVKKDGTKEAFKTDKIAKAVTKSAERVMVDISESEMEQFCNKVSKKAQDLAQERGNDFLEVADMHRIVENCLNEFNSDVAKSYRDYRNYKTEFVGTMDKVYKETQKIMYIGDRDNANTDSTLTSTRRSLVYNVLNKELYKKFFLRTDELQAVRDGYIYIHDMSARRDTINCCLADIESVLTGGFELANQWYNEPKTLDTAFDVIGDIVLSAASQQYGGFTVPEVDKILNKYAELSYDKYYKEISSEKLKVLDTLSSAVGVKEYYIIESSIKRESEKLAIEKVKRDFEQGFQGWEYKFNTVASSRGDYPFVACTFGLGTKRFERMASIAILNTRAGGQGKAGFKRLVLFPKLIFLYDSKIHGEGKVNRDVYDAAIDCSMKAMYPDWLSLEPGSYVGDTYQKYGEVISPMGCADGKEVITYKLDGSLLVESFERMWRRITKRYVDRGQKSDNDANRVVDLRNSDVYIYDTLKGFTKVKYLIRNIQNNWCDVTLSSGKSLRVTTDHPFETQRGVVLAKYLRCDDIMKVGTKQYSEPSYKKAPDFVWLNGYILCEGVYKDCSLLVKIREGLRYRFEEDIIRLGHLILEIALRKVWNNTGALDNCTYLKATSDEYYDVRKVVEYYTHLFGGINKEDRCIPSEVFSYYNSAKYAFLAGMIDASGQVNHRLIPDEVDTIVFKGLNKELSLQLVALVQSLGMKVTIKYNYCQTNNPREKEKVTCEVEFVPDIYIEKLLSISEPIRSSRKYNRGVIDSNVKNVKFLTLKQYSYDVTTESEHFELSGVYSHNCRAFLSPYYPEGGLVPAYENEKPVYVGRFNLGVVSLNLPMIFVKAKQENKDFYEVLDYYLEVIRNIHKRTYDYIGEMRASTNPLMYTQGGFMGGNLSPNDKVRPILKYTTSSYGVTALNELQQLYNQKSIYEDGEFCKEVMKHITDVVMRYKFEDNINYAIYGTPAESLCTTQVKQFREKYGIVHNVSDREYFTNSFHCHVSENITPTEKQDAEKRFWDLFNGGKIQYVRYRNSSNRKAFETLIDRAMKMGFYEGVNMDKDYCEDCGYQSIDFKDHECPKCGSKNIIEVNRVCGYLGYSKIHGKSRMNDGKLAEIQDRMSM